MASTLIASSSTATGLRAPGAKVTVTARTKACRRARFAVKVGFMLARARDCSLVGACPVGGVMRHYSTHVTHTIYYPLLAPIPPSLRTPHHVGVPRPLTVPLAATIDRCLWIERAIDENLAFRAVSAFRRQRVCNVRERERERERRGGRLESSSSLGQRRETLHTAKEPLPCMSVEKISFFPFPIGFFPCLTRDAERSGYEKLKKCSTH